jgi:hypothetical protein
MGDQEDTLPGVWVDAVNSDVLLVVMNVRLRILLFAHHNVDLVDDLSDSANTAFARLWLDRPAGGVA